MISLKHEKFKGFFAISWDITNIHIFSDGNIVKKYKLCCFYEQETPIFRDFSAIA